MTERHDMSSIQKPRLEDSIVRSSSVPAEKPAGNVNRWVAALAADPGLQAFWIPRIGLMIAPIVAGVDKFLHALVNWDQYLAPVITNLFGGRAHAFMTHCRRYRDRTETGSRYPAARLLIWRPAVAARHPCQLADGLRMLRHCPARSRLSPYRLGPGPPERSVWTWTPYSTPGQRD